MQMHGAAGMSQWFAAGSHVRRPCAHLRYADGPDEVHHMVVGRAETRKYTGEEEDPAMAAVWRK
jgi:acyl-CoA dehydrogenase